VQAVQKRSRASHEMKRGEGSGFIKIKNEKMRVVRNSWESASERLLLNEKGLQVREFASGGPTYQDKTLSKEM